MGPLLIRWVASGPLAETSSRPPRLPPVGRWWCDSVCYQRRSVCSRNQHRRKLLSANPPVARYRLSLHTEILTFLYTGFILHLPTASLRNVCWTPWRIARAPLLKPIVLKLLLLYLRSLQLSTEKVVVNSAEKFYQCAKECCPTVCILFVPASTIANVRTELEVLRAAKEPRKIPSTYELHFVKAPSSVSVDVAVVSPFLKVAKSSAKPNDIVPLRSVQIFDSETSLKEVSCSNAINTITVELEKHYAIDYINRFYIGRVLSRTEKQGYWRMKFLHQYSRNGKVWFWWPRAADWDATIVP